MPMTSGGIRAKRERAREAAKVSFAGSASRARVTLLVGPVTTLRRFGATAPAHFETMEDGAIHYLELFHEEIGDKNGMLLL